MAGKLCVLCTADEKQLSVISFLCKLTRKQFLSLTFYCPFSPVPFDYKAEGRESWVIRVEEKLSWSLWLALTNREAHLSVVPYLFTISP